MKVVAKHENIADCKVRIKLEIAPEEFTLAFARVLKQAASKVNMPGFRKGKVPQSMILTSHGDMLYEETLSSVVSNAVRYVAEREEIALYGNPNLEEGSYDKKIRFDKPFNKPFKINVVGYRPPSCKIKPLKKLSVTIPTCKVSDDDVRRAKEEQLRPYGKMEEAKDTIRALDILTISLNFSDDGFSQFNLKEHVFYFDENGEVTPPAYLKGIHSALVSMKMGEEKIFKHKFPVLEGDEYAALSKTKTEVKLTVNTVKRMALPELNAELLKKMNYESEASMEKQLREKLEKQVEEKLNEQKTRLVLNELKKQTQFEIPEPAKNTMISHYWQNYLARYVQEAEREKTKPNAQWLKEAQRHAIVEIEDELIFTEMPKMREKELAVDEKAVEEEISAMKLKMKGDENLAEEARLQNERQLESEEAKKRVRAMLERRKVVDFIFQKTEIKSGKAQTLQQLLQNFS